MGLENTELNELLEALKLGQERALELMISTGSEIFGLSFDENGKVKWQFLVQKVFGQRALIMTYSWVDGSEYSTENVSIEFLKNECALFLDEKEWQKTGLNMSMREIKRNREEWQVK